MAAKKKRGFASMTPEKLRQVASRAGKAAQAGGKAHRWNREEAQAAGAIGGKEAHKRKTAHVFTHEEAVQAGKKGGTIAAEIARQKRNNSVSPTSPDNQSPQVT